MTISATRCFSCQHELGEPGSKFTIDATDYVTVVLHTTEKGIEHKVHQYCIYERFLIHSQNWGGGDGILSCPLCEKRILPQDAEKVSGAAMGFFS